MKELSLNVISQTAKEESETEIQQFKDSLQHMQFEEINKIGFSKLKSHNNIYSQAPPICQEPRPRSSSPRRQYTFIYLLYSTRGLLSIQSPTSSLMPEFPEP